MIYLDFFVGVLTAPFATLRTLAATPRPGAAVVVHSLIILITTLAGAYVAPGAAPLALPVGAGLAVVFGLLGFFLYTAVLHLSAEFLGGQGRALALFTTLAFASAPGVLLAPFGLAVRAAPPMFYYLVSVVLGLWVLVLHLLSIQAVHRLSLWRSLAAFLLPWAMVVVAAVLSLALGVAALLPHLKGFTWPA